MLIGATLGVATGVSSTRAVLDTDLVAHRMTELYKPETFEPLTETPWDAARVVDAIQAIATAAEDAFDEKELWPAGEWESYLTPLPITSLYVGAAGVLWALHALRRRGRAEGTLDLANAIARALDAWRRQPGLMSDTELPSTAEAALLTGESGILMTAWLIEPTAERADRLHDRIRQNASNEAIEVMWGSPGTMLAAAELHRRTGEERWAEAWRESARILLGAREDDGLWPNQLYGELRRSLTPPHGVVGNVQALLDGDELLDEARRRTLRRETNDVLRRNAVVEGGLANWSARADGSLGGPAGEGRVQWCAGAPGIVIAAAPYLDEDLLLGGAELVWQAGPHGEDKGPSICHGTAGNGYALLRTFERTGDERWLERARRFAMHALEQVERRESRYALWTGDVGVALFASDCLDARARYPILETWA
jgi:lantibiotic modifying enzyme